MMKAGLLGPCDNGLNMIIQLYNSSYVYFLLITATYFIMCIVLWFALTCFLGGTSL